MGIYDKCIEKVIHQELFNTKVPPHMVFTEFPNHEPLATGTGFWRNVTTHDLISTHMDEQREGEKKDLK